jgi:hypothetical protein
MDRLNQALALLGYKPEQTPHIRHNLLGAIQAFAAMQNDEALEEACEVDMRAIRAVTAQ